MSKQDATRRLARDLHGHRHDPDEWGDEAESIEVRPAPTTVVSCRLPVEEFHDLEQSARDARESLSEYIRKAIALRHAGAGPDASRQPPASVTIVRVYAVAPGERWSSALKPPRMAS